MGQVRLLIVLGMGLMGAALHAHHSHTEVVVEESGHWHHPDERVYVNYPWYHHDHVYYYQGHAYPHYYYGQPYYYYDPHYYWMEPAPVFNVNIN